MDSKKMRIAFYGCSPRVLRPRPFWVSVYAYLHISGCRKNMGPFRDFARGHELSTVAITLRNPASIINMELLSMILMVAPNSEGHAYNGITRSMIVQYGSSQKVGI